MEECIIGQGVIIGENCRLRRVIVDAHTKIPANSVIGFEPFVSDENRVYDEESGISVIPMPKIQLRKKMEMPSDTRYSQTVDFSEF